VFQLPDCLVKNILQIDETFLFTAKDITVTIEAYHFTE